MSANAVAQRRLDGGAGLQRAEHVNGSDGRARQFGRNIGRNNRETQNLNVKRLAGGLNGLQIAPRVMADAEIQLVTRDGLLDSIAIAIELVADRRADEIGAIGVEPLPHQQIDMPEIDVTEIDRDLLAVSLRTKLLHLGHHFRHPITIHMDGI